jgi:hypothetical protein
MKLPEKPPNWRSIISQGLQKNDASLEELTSFSDEKKEYVQKCNLQDYHYWDKVKYIKPLPPKFTPELGWVYLKFRRLGQMIWIPLKDQQNHPFGFIVSPFIQKSLHEIDRDTPRRIETENPNIHQSGDKYILSSIMEEAIASSQIEGAVTTREVAKEMLRSGRKPQNKSEQMILNNYMAMQEIRKMQDQPLTLEMILQLHEILGRDALDKPEALGRWRLAKRCAC